MKMALAASSVRRLIPVGVRFLSNVKETHEAKPSQPKPAAAKPVASKPASAPVGPGASKEGAYKNPEYYTYNPMSFYDIEKDMKSFRIPQPSSRK